MRCQYRAGIATCKRCGNAGPSPLHSQHRRGQKRSANGACYGRARPTQSTPEDVASGVADVGSHGVRALLLVKLKCLCCGHASAPSSHRRRACQPMPRDAHLRHHGPSSSAVALRLAARGVPGTEAAEQCLSVPARSAHDAPVPQRLDNRHATRWRCRRPDSGYRLRRQ